MAYILFALFCGLIWAWRGWTYPVFLTRYARAFVSSLLIVLAYIIGFNKQMLFMQAFQIMIILTIVESILGYGTTCETIDDYFSINTIGCKIDKKIIESFMYLGFIGLMYYLSGFSLILDWTFTKKIIFAIIGFMIFPTAKLMQIKFFNNLNFDAWKIVEFIIGMGFVLWTI